MVLQLSYADAPRCTDLAQRVGWPREPAKWRLLLEMGRGFGTSSAGAGGALDSMVVLTAYDATCFVAMMVVDPDQQGRGLGRTLLEAALVDAREPALLYATSAGEPLYRRLGFQPIDHVVKLEGVTPDVTAAALATARARGVRPADASDRDAILRADEAAFGGSRAALLSAILDLADRVVVDEHGGFAVRYHNGALTVIGPVVADDEDAAIALVDAAGEGLSGTWRLDAPVSSPLLAAHVRGLGLADLGTFPLMSRPAAPPPGDRRRYHAICLQAFG